MMMMNQENQPSTITSATLTLNEKLYAKLEKYCRDFHKREHYEYQKLISHAIIDALIASNIENRTYEAAFEFPRQCGKTTGVVDTCEFIIAVARKVFKKPISIGIFAPQKEQATTDFDRLKNQFAEIESLGLRTSVKQRGSDPKLPEKWNSKTIRLYDDRNRYLGEVYIFPVSKTSRPESKTFDLIIVEEAQDVDDNRLQNAVFPMGASTNAPRIYIGTAGIRLCYFLTQLQSNPLSKKIKLEEIIKNREAMHAKTGDPYHLKYKVFVENEIKEHGKDSDYIQRQYLGQWILGTGQFTTKEKIEAMIGDFGYITKSEKDMPEYFGIDTAKSPDKTVVTVLRDNPKMSKAQLCGWLVLQGENYEKQFYIIKDWLSQFKNIRGGAIDATGQGDFMPDMFENHTSYNIIRVKFSAEMKDIIFKILLQTIENKATLLPKVNDETFRTFLMEMINLQKEYKGRYMSVHHPDDPKAHDDFPDSWALAEYARVETVRKEPRITFM